MKKKSIISIVVATSLVAAIGIGSTLAYFTDTESASNLVTMGHVDITLTENTVVYNEVTNQYDQEGTERITSEGLTFTRVTPGQVIPKNPTVTVADGSEDCYVYVKLSIIAEDGSRLTSDELAALQASIDAQIADDSTWNKVVWRDDNGAITYYCNDVVTAGNSVVLFDEVQIPTGWGNNTADQSFRIELTAAAIQADNITVGTDGVIRTNAAGNIIGWSGITPDNYDPVTTPENPADGNPETE